ncbi:MAG: CHAP domain-containing protein [Alphaproteobacteria bacterium]|nr:CHAP domain-containing protein [Alphaproteobacteria bacterium]
MAAKGTAEKLVEVALGEEGYVEGPKDNETKYGAFTKANFLPWCGSFVMWCANEAGVKVPNTVSTMAGAAAFKKMGTWTDAKDAKPAPGDIVYFDFAEGGAPIEHVGIVVKDNGDGTVTTIEGNTAGDKKKSNSQRNGGEAVVKIRAYKTNKKKIPAFIVGFVIGICFFLVMRHGNYFASLYKLISTGSRLMLLLSNA